MSRLGRRRSWRGLSLWLPAQVDGEANAGDAAVARGVRRRRRKDRRRRPFAVEARSVQLGFDRRPEAVELARARPARVTQLGAHQLERLHQPLFAEQRCGDLASAVEFRVRFRDFGLTRLRPPRRCHVFDPFQSARRPSGRGQPPGRDSPFCFLRPPTFKRPARSVVVALGARWLGRPIRPSAAVAAALGAFSFSSASPIEKLPGFCRGGKGLKV